MSEEFVDTNVFLRFLTNDVPRQAKAVEELLSEAASGRRQLVTSALVVSEIVWTLESFYGLEPSSIREQVLAILNTPGLHVENAGLIVQAVSDYADLNVDFADAYNAAWARENHLSPVHTFDERHFRRLDVNVNVPGR